MTLIDIKIFQIHLKHLKKLQLDLEKQMLRLDEIIPYEHQVTSKIYSPRLLNMILACGPQFEAIVKLIAKKCNIEENRIPSIFKEINHDKVLSNFPIVSIQHNVLFRPFTEEGITWWHTYNCIKHELTSNQFQLTYELVMDALASLTGVHCLAEKLFSSHLEDIPYVLNHQNWTDHNLNFTITSSKTQIPKNISYTYKSLMFEVKMKLPEIER